MNSENNNFHFTYSKTSTDQLNLHQGDILEKTDELKKVLSRIHKYYLKEDYQRFIVLTQSCDLEIRDNGICNSRYISIAPIRPLEIVIKREIEKYQDELSKIGEVCSEKKKTKLEQFLERLLNNNEKDYFYLHEEPDAGFFPRGCAFLRLSITLKTDDHYKTCLNSRILSLSDIFKAKLGWLVGNIYSRVGTKDWVPGTKDDDEFKEMISDILDEVCQWVDDRKLNQLKKDAKGNPEILRKNRDEIRNIIEEMKKKNKPEELAKRVKEILIEKEFVRDDKQLDNIFNSIRNDTEISSILK